LLVEEPALALTERPVALEALAPQLARIDPEARQRSFDHVRALRRTCPGRVLQRRDPTLEIRCQLRADAGSVKYVE
jgi:hypothetical protein